MRPRMRLPAARAVILLSQVCFTACLPYTVASTARPAEKDEVLTTATWYAIPNAVDVAGDSAAGPIYGADAEARFGLDDRSDVGVRLPSFSGVVLTYKRRLDGPTTDDGPAVAFMGGGGIVNLGAHAHVELTMIASGAEQMLTPYGGVRAMHVLPMSRGAATDSPTLGGFVGLRIGTRDRGISPEIGVYYDRSTLDLRKRDFIVVPAISVHGEDLLRALRPR